MPLRINKNWKTYINQRIDEHQLIDETISWNTSAKWLIKTLAEENVPFKVYNLGAGVKRITTDTATCPCCKRRL